MSTADKGLPEIFQRAISLAGLAVSWPLLGAAAMAIKATSQGPALFRQERMGKEGKSFTLYKFRTMAQSNSGPGVTVDGDRRITRIGRILRKTKLDELPELFNVLRGDMALVGPRPEVPEYVDLDDPLWRETLEVRPGLTHPVTLALRNEEDLLLECEGNPVDFYKQTLLPYKLRGYIDYARAQTWHGDLLVLAKTVLVVLVPQMAESPSPEDLARAGKQGKETSLPE
jgi:lipopolysaccharide/colanic/teichoic acid biosynthesis glycosyltransferase